MAIRGELMDKLINRSFIMFIGISLRMSGAAPAAAATKPRHPEFLDPALAPLHKPFANRSGGPTAAGVEQPETRAVLEEGADLFFAEDAAAALVHELLQQRELLDHPREEREVFAIFITRVLGPSRDVQAPQRRRPVGEVEEEIAVDGAAEGLAAAGAAVHGGARQRPPCPQSGFAAAGEVDVAPDLGLVGGRVPPGRAREPRAAEDVDLRNPAEDGAQDVMGQRRPVPRLRRRRRMGYVVAAAAAAAGRRRRGLLIGGCWGLPFPLGPCSHL